MSEGTRKGAIGGALVGLTMGALTGDAGYAAAGAVNNRYVGHYDNQAAKYEFFYAGTDQDTFTGVKRTDYQLLMKMIGIDVIVFETWASVDGQEKRLQSYRLTRQG